MLDAAETLAMVEALNRIGEDFRKSTLHPTQDDEDVHTFIERVLTERLAALGGKLRRPLTQRPDRQRLASVST